jgi:hypothetical protein
MEHAMKLTAPLLGAAAFAIACAIALPASAQDDKLGRAEMARETHGYYSSEMTSAYLFVAAGAVHAGVGGIALTQSGDFAKSFGYTSVVLGTLTAIGGAGYGFTVKPRGEHFDALLAKDPVKFKSEELDHIHGTNSRFVLYLGFEITETLAGAGVATYGFVKDKDVIKGLGLGTAIQGVSLLALDVPGAIRASSYQDEVRHFDPASARAGRPNVGFSVGDGERPWLLTVDGRF